MLFTHLLMVAPLGALTGGLPALSLMLQLEPLIFPEFWRMGQGLSGRKYPSNLSFQGVCLLRPSAFLLLLVCLSLQDARLHAKAAVSEPFPDPTIVSVFPLGAQQGTEINLEMRGEALDGAYAVLFDSEGFKAEVQEVAEIEPEVKESDDPSEDPTKEEEEKAPPIFRVVQKDDSCPAGRPGCSCHPDAPVAESESQADCGRAGWRTRSRGGDPPYGRQTGPCRSQQRVTG